MAKGEVSVLAIVETLLAIALVFYLSAHFNTLRWLAVAMCVSPLLLLRTEKSTRLGIKWWDWWDCRFWKILKDKFWTIIFGCTGLLTIAMIFGPTIVRVSAAITSVILEPLESFRAIPKNWARIALAVDTRQPPEMIPDHPDFTLHKVLYKHGAIKRVSTTILMFGNWFLPALFYRWSLKATSIIYAPLVFVAYSTFSEGKDLRTKLELIKRGDLSRIRALYGVVAIVAFLVKLVLMIKWNGFVEVWKGNPITEFLALYIAPAEIPKWQLAEIANSVLAVGAMLFARHALLRYELNNPWPEKLVKQILGFVSGLRWLLALYAIVCLGYITMRAAHDWHWPALGIKWLPFL